MRTQLQEDKDRAESTAKQRRRDYERVNMELTALRESVQSRHEAHTKEKLEFQNYIHEIESKVKRLQESEQEKHELRQTLKERESQIEDYKRNERHLRDERDRIKARVGYRFYSHIHIILSYVYIWWKSAEENEGFCVLSDGRASDEGERIGTS